MTDPFCIKSGKANHNRCNTLRATIGMGGAMLMLWLMGTPHAWTGAVAGLAAIILCRFYTASEELCAAWSIQDPELKDPFERSITLKKTDSEPGIMGDVQIIPKTGDTHLIKYLADPRVTTLETKGAL